MDVAESRFYYCDHMEGSASGGDHRRERSGRGSELEEIATAEYVAGNRPESEAAWARAHEEYLAEGNVPRAARSAFWVGILATDAGEHARAQGWFARAQR